MTDKLFHNSWATLLASRLLPVALLITCLALLEGLARFAIYIKYGNSKTAIRETLNYAPFVIAIDDTTIYNVPSKGPGVTRVLILGSSTAAQIPIDVWKGIFAEHDSGQIEVINCSQWGYNSTQELLLFALYGLQAAPDYVITLDGIVDIVDLTKTGSVRIPPLNLIIEQAMNNPNLFFLERLCRSSQLVNLMRKLNERKREISMQSDSAANAEMAVIYRQNLEKISILCAGTGSRYISILQPYIHLRKNSPSIEQTLGNNFTFRKAYISAAMLRLHDEMESSHLRGQAIFIDGIDAFDQAPDVECFIDEAHLTREGQDLLIKTIRQRLAVSKRAMQN